MTLLNQMNNLLLNFICSIKLNAFYLQINLKYYILTLFIDLIYFLDKRKPLVYLSHRQTPYFKYKC